ncbi:MAG: hypothetical protein Q4G60_10635 [bacterium]|nr:hypothetical protein [bacterium]
MFEKTKHIVTWEDIEGSQWEKIVWAENKEKAKYKAFKILKDEEGVFNEKCTFMDFIKYYLVSVTN